MSIASQNTKIHNPDRPLHTRYTIRGVDIPSRFFLAPINTGFFLNGAPTEGLRQFHKERSGRAIGISYVGNVAVHPAYVNSPATAFLSSNPSWRVIAETILEGGSVPAIQLACKTMRESAPRTWVNAEVDEFVQRAKSQLLAMPKDSLDEACDRFVSACELAWQQGFRVIQVHAAHGYFLSLLLSREINWRKDQYGDGVEVLRRLVRSIRSLSLPLVLDIRLSLTSGLRDRDEELADFESRVLQITSEEVDILSLSDGFYDVDKFRIYPRREDGLGCHVGLVSRFARNSGGQLWNVAGNVWDVSIASSLPCNLSLSIGRSLIADPSFVEKHLAGEVSRIQCCIRSGQCHYYSRNTPHIECGVNPRVGGQASRHDPIAD